MHFHNHMGCYLIKVINQRSLTLLVDRKTWGSPLHVTPVATSLCSLNAAKGIYGRRTSQTLMLQSTTRAQLAMWYFRWGLHLMCPTDAMVWIVYSSDGLPARSHTYKDMSGKVYISETYIFQMHSVLFCIHHYLIYCKYKFTFINKIAQHAS